MKLDELKGTGCSRLICELELRISTICIATFSYDDCGKFEYSVSGFVEQYIESIDDRIQRHYLDTYSFNSTIYDVDVDCKDYHKHINGKKTKRKIVDRIGLKP